MTAPTTPGPNAATAHPWETWISRVENRLGHDVDGDQTTDGFSIDLAFDLWNAGATVGAAVSWFDAVANELGRLPWRDWWAEVRDHANRPSHSLRTEAFDLWLSGHSPADARRALTDARPEPVVDQFVDHRGPALRHVTGDPDHGIEPGATFRPDPASVVSTPAENRRAVLGVVACGLATVVVLVLGAAADLAGWFL